MSFGVSAHLPCRYNSTHCFLYDDFTPEKADFETEDDFARFMDFVKSANLHENDMTVTGDDHLLTLITCDRTYGGADGRFVVMAVREDL